MEIKAEYIRDPRAIEQFKEEIVQARAIGIDLETRGFDPLTKNPRLLQIATGPERGFIFDLDHVKPGELDWLGKRIADPNVTKIFQNGKFDMKFLMRHFNWQHFPTVYDTFLASVLIACGDSDARHNLGILVENYLGIQIDKQYGASDWNEPELSEEQLSYAIKDACLLHPLRDAQNVFLKTLDLERVALLEFDCVEAVAALELNGFYLNHDHWQERLDRQAVRKTELEKQTKEHFKDIVPVSLFGEIEVDLDSPVKLLPLLKKLGVPLTGGTMEDELKPFIESFPVVKDLLDYREMATALKMFGPDYLDFISSADGRIHADFRQIGTPTGRFTCVVGSTPIEAPRDLLKYPEGIPIKKLQPGQWVYSRTINGKLCLRKVKRVWSNGLRKTIKVHLSCKGRPNQVLQVTPEHLVKLGWQNYSTWIPACRLKPGHLLQTMNRRVIEEGYCWLTGALERFGHDTPTSSRSREHRYVYAQVNQIANLSSKRVVHHEDENTINNTPDNLHYMPMGEHISLHNSLRVNGKAKPKDWSIVNQTGGKHFKDLKYYKVDFIEDGGIEEVWDLEVESNLEQEHTPYFFANQVLIHNCNKPNLQQVPGEDQYRQSFQAQGGGRSLIIADYSMIELRIMAEFSLDEKMLEAFQNNIDLHQYTGSHAFGLPLEAAAKGTAQRQIGKMLNFGTGYGAAAPRFAAISGLSLAKSKESLGAFWGLYAGLDKYMKECEARAVEENETHSFSGRTWRLDYDPADQHSIGTVQRIGRNMPIQGTCSDIMKRAMYFMRNATRGKDIKLANVVHDEAVNEIDNELREEAEQIVSDSMIRAAEEVLTRVPAKIDINVSDVWKK